MAHDKQADDDSAHGTLVKDEPAEDETLDDDFLAMLSDVGDYESISDADSNDGSVSDVDEDDGCEEGSSHGVGEDQSLFDSRALSVEHTPLPANVSSSSTSSILGIFCQIVWAALCGATAQRPVSIYRRYFPTTDALFASMNRLGITFADGLLEILKSPLPPSIDISRTSPLCRTGKTCGV